MIRELLPYSQGLAVTAGSLLVISFAVIVLLAETSLMRQPVQYLAACLMLACGPGNAWQVALGGSIYSGNFLGAAIATVIALLSFIYAAVFERTRRFLFAVGGITWMATGYLYGVAIWV